MDPLPIPKVLIKIIEIDKDYSIGDIDVSRGHFEIKNDAIIIKWLYELPLFDYRDNASIYLALYNHLIQGLITHYKFKINDFEMGFVNNVDGVVCLRLKKDAFKKPEAKLLKAMMNFSFTIRPKFSGLLSYETKRKQNFKMQPVDEEYNDDNKPDTKPDEKVDDYEMSSSDGSDGESETESIASAVSSRASKRKMDVQTAPSSLGSSIIHKFTDLNIYKRNRNIDRDVVLPLTQIVGLIQDENYDQIDAMLGVVERQMNVYGINPNINNNSNRQYSIDEIETAAENVGVGQETIIDLFNKIKNRK